MRGCGPCAGCYSFSLMANYLFGLSVFTLIKMTGKHGQRRVVSFDKVAAILNPWPTLKDLLEDSQ